MAQEYNGILRSPLIRITTYETRELIIKYINNPSMIFKGYFTYTILNDMRHIYCAVFKVNDMLMYTSMNIINNIPRYSFINSNRLIYAINGLYNNLLIKEQPMINALMYVDYLDLLPELRNYIKKFII